MQRAAPLGGPFLWFTQSPKGTKGPTSRASPAPPLRGKLGEDLAHIKQETSSQRWRETTPSVFVALTGPCAANQSLEMCERVRFNDLLADGN